MTTTGDTRTGVGIYIVNRSLRKEQWFGRAYSPNINGVAPRLTLDPLITKENLTVRNTIIT